jgi:hypothetical protein
MCDKARVFCKKSTLFAFVAKKAHAGRLQVAEFKILFMKFRGLRA